MRLLRLPLLVFSLAAAGGGTAAAQCPVAPLKGQWNSAEITTWEQLCSGNNGQAIDLATAQGPTVLSANFIRDVLTSPKLAEALHPYGVRIKNAVVQGDLDLSASNIPHEIWLDETRFTGKVDFRSANLAKDISFSGSEFAREFSLELARLERSLTINQAAKFKGNVNLRGAYIAGSVNAERATIEEKLEANSGTFGRSFLANSAKLNDVEMVDAAIAHNLEMRSSQIGSLDLHQATIGRSLLLDPVEDARPTELGILRLPNATVQQTLNLRHAVIRCPDAGSVDFSGLTVNGSIRAQRSKFQEPCPLTLRGANVANEILLEGASVGGPLILDAARLGGSLFFGAGDETRPCAAPSRYLNAIRARYAHFGADLSLAGAHIAEIDLSGSQVAGELRTGTKNCGFADDARIALDGVRAGSLRLNAGDWPDHPSLLSLQGFTYQHIYDGNRHTAPDMASYLNWLKRQSPPSAQGYTQMANVLKAAGFDDEAKQILFANRWRIFLADMRDFRVLETFFGALSWALIGFGYYPITALWLAVLLTAIGTLMFRDACREAHSPVNPIVFSLDNLLPIIELSNDDAEVRPQGRAKTYLYVHRAAGYILATFLVAGLSGLTK